MREAEPREAHLLDYWRILAKRRWVVYTCLAVTVTTVMLRSLLMEPVYTATTTLQIERQNPNVLPFQRVATDGGEQFFGFYETQYGLITSRRVAREVIRVLGLREHPEFRVESPGRVATGLTPEEVAEGARINLFLTLLNVSPVSKSRLVNVSFSSRDRVLSAKAANQVAETYIAFNTQAEYNTTEQASTSLGEQVASLQAEIQEMEKRLQAYATEHGIVPINETQDITLQNLTDLSKSLTAARGVRIEKESRFASLEESAPQDVDEVRESRLIGELAAKRIELARRHAELSEKYGPAWPELSRVKGEMEEIDGRIERESTAVYGQILGAAEADYRAARKEEAGLEKALEGLKGQARALSLKEIEYRKLKGEIENRRQTLEAILRRQGEARTTAGMNEVTSSNVRIVDRAEIPVRASSPRIGMNFILSFASGLALGIGLALFFEYVDKSVKSGEEVHAVTGLPVLGVIPMWRPDGPRLRLVWSNGSEEARSTATVGLIAHEYPASKISEAVREMRTTLLVSRPGGPPRMILVTSSQPSEGKTAISANLAVSLAQAGRRVLLVDADMRKPRIHAIFGLSNGRGLSTALGGAGSEGLAIQPTRVEGLDVLASGPPPPNPADLLNSNRFAEIEGRLLSAGYDHVIFDSPPILVVADACIIAARMESVIVVAWAGVTGRDALEHAVGRLRQVKAQLTGAVLNKAEPESRYYGSYTETARERAEIAAPEGSVSSDAGTGTDPRA